MSPNWQKDNRLALSNDQPRVDLPEKATGRAKYTTDHSLDKTLWAGYIRCPYGKAKLTGADEAAAKKVPGVVEVTIQDREADYCGYRLGYVVAESRQALDDALAALKCEFEIQTPTTTAEQAMTPLAQVNARGADQAEAALKNAAHVVEAVYQTQVQTHSALEVHNALVDYRGDHAVAWGSSQGTFAFQQELLRPLGLPGDKVEFHCEYIGGGFGAKLQGAGPEGLLAAQMSKKYNRPCRVLLTRKEEHLDTGNRPGSWQYMKIGIDADGKLVGGRVHTVGLVGPQGGGGNVDNPARYSFGAIAQSHEEAHLNAGFPRSMRAPGHPQGMFGVEMMMDELANKAGIDPLEFRKKNDPDPVRREMYDVAAELIGWKDRKPASEQKGPIKIGYGIGIGSWFNRGGRATVTVNIRPDGSIEALNGAQDIGTGFRTMLADCVASVLGVPAAQVGVKVGRSDLPYGPSSGGSTTSRAVGPRAQEAARQAREKLLGLVAQEWQLGDTSGLRIADGKITGPGGKSTDWAKACKLAAPDGISATSSNVGSFYDQITDSQAVQMARVAVDVETGIVRVQKVVALQEMGQAVNRMTAENQMTGAVIEALSYALFEDRILNKQTGAMVNPNLEMYKIAGSMDIPEIVPVIWQSNPNAAINSLGEPPAVPGPGMLGCAVAAAIGTPVRTMPITPRRVLAALGKAQGGMV